MMMMLRVLDIDPEVLAQEWLMSKIATGVRGEEQEVGKPKFELKFCVLGS
jgi:hypothetical protein